MSVTRKRPLTVEGEGESAKDSKDKEKKTVSQSRPPKPTAKRRKTGDSTDNPKNQALESKALGKGKRQAWTKAAIDAFYEGLYQHGKDFQKILKYMQGKQKKLNDPTIGNLTKDQVRFFYYRNWHKVEPHLISPAHHHSAAESKKTSKSSAPQTPVTPFSEVNEDSAIEDHHGTEPENLLDSSVEELDPPSPSGPGTSQEQDVRENPSPGGRVLSEKTKEQVQSSPLSVSTDKSEGKVKDTVLVNGTKQSLDLVALICYSKLRKKSLGDHNIWRRLSELVFQGVTSVPSRVKGKRKALIRIPNCGAFRGPVRKPAIEDHPVSNESTTDSAPSESVTAVEAKAVPGEEGEMVVELRPLTSATWVHVQSLSHNPRVRMHLDGVESLATLRDYIALKWKLDKTYSLKFYSTKSLDSSASQPSFPPTSHPHNHPLHRSLPSPHPPNHSSHQSSPKSALLASEREARSLPSSPNQFTTHSESHINSYSVPATPSSGIKRSEVTETKSPKNITLKVTGINSVEGTVNKPPERSEVVESKPSETAANECEGKSNCSCSVARDECVLTNHQKSPPSVCVKDHQSSDSGLNTKAGFTESVKAAEVDLSCSLNEVAAKLRGSRCVQLSYEITKSKGESRYTDRLRAALKLVEFFLKKCPTSGQPQSLTPVKKSSVITHQSPKVIEYMQTLSRHSPQKSPLSKYRRRLKQKSPLKRITSHTVNFSSNSGTTDTTSVPSSAHSASPVPTTSGDKPTQPLLLASPKSIGSFANFKIQSLFPDTNKQPQPSTLRQPTSVTKAQHLSSQSPRQLLARVSQSGASSLTPSNIPVTVSGSTPSYLVLGSPSLSVNPSASAVAHVIPGGATVMPPGAPLKPMALLSPGVHRIHPRMTNSTASQLSHDLATPTLHDPKTQGDKDKGSNVVSVMSALKPFKKPKRLKKLPAKPGQPHQLVPRPLPFLRDVNLGSSAGTSAQSGPSTTVTHTVPLQVTPALSGSPLKVSKQSSPRKTTAALIQNQQMMLQLIQSYMLQQQRNQLSKSKALPVASHSQTPLVQQHATAAIAGSQVAGTSGQATEISEKELQSTLVSNYLAEGAVTDSTSSRLFHTSSDTVNNLLKGLSSVKPSNSIQKLSEETADVLPTFAKALGNSYLSPDSREPTEKESVKETGNAQADVCIESGEPGRPFGEDKPVSGDKSVVLRPNSEDSQQQMPFLHDVSSTSLNDLLGTLTDSNFKQVADSGDFLENVDFTDMFSQLKDVMTPEKDKHSNSGEDSQSSMNNLLEYINCSPEKRPYTAPVDPACRSFLEEGSVDFIQKFKELASTMEGRSSAH